ncbi:MAG: hypothetical protein ACREEM_40370, partial [Blastocatellia bacterium]
MQFSQSLLAKRGLASAFITAFALALLCSIVKAQTGISILSDNLYEFSGAVGANAIAIPVAVTGQPFAQAYRIAVNGTSAKIYDAGLWWRTTQQVNQGDNLQITFWVRKIAPLDGNNIRSFVGFEKAGNAKSLFAVFPCDSDVWRKYIIPFKAAVNY